MKRLISLFICCAIALSLCIPALAIDDQNRITMPKNITTFMNNGIMPLEEPNDECGRTGHVPPAGYRWVGTTHGNTRDDNIQATGAGFFITLIVPSLGTLVGLIGLGIALDPSTIAGDYTIYEWSNGRNTWQHVVGYVTYEKTNGDVVTEFVNCEVRTS